jgi:hypothetical protein
MVILRGVGVEVTEHLALDLQVCKVAEVPSLLVRVYRVTSIIRKRTPL